MKTLTPALKALFAGRRFLAANLYSFQLSSGLVLRYTTWDRDLIWNGNTFSCGKPNGPFIERSSNSNGSSPACQWKVGLEVNTLQFEIIPGKATINGVPFLQACRNGAFDGALLRRERAYMDMADPATVVGTVVLDVGRLAEVDAGRSFATINVADPRELLNQSTPTHLYQKSCINTLYDQGCRVSRAAFTTAGAALAGSSAGQVTNSLAQPSGYFDLGVVTFTSGRNAGVARTVKSHVLGQPILLIQPFSYVPAAGDTFNIVPGCNKSLGICISKFGNGSHFRGFPFIPDAATAQ